ncbi:restriction endonuclease subunit S [Staphylococcus cohnii species complex 1659]|uniref:restriction endonuclease subunit S n=1 Tax=Staphylococcus TaxID=1279 RepID=UPI001AEBE896|nr:restriction endonuclease subunit S [Staphylococcus sp. GDH8C126P]
MEFKKYKIEEIGTVVGGGTPSTKNDNYYGGNISWITPKDLSNYSNRYIYHGERNITEEGLNNSSAKLVPTDTILMTSRAPIGYLALAGKKVATNQGFKSIICNEEIVSPKYLYYLLQNKIDNIKSLGTGSTFSEISGKVVKNIEVSLPNLLNQKRVEKVLDSIDEKIELNQKIITNLEELSQTLFKRWFVDFEFPDENGNPYKSSGGEMIDSELGEIPLNWKCSKIKDINVIISDHVANGSFKSLKENVQFTEDLNDKYAVFARNVDLKKGDNRFEKYVTKSSYEFLRKSHLHGHEVIISNVGDVGSVYLSPILNRPMVLGNNQIFINSDEKSLNYYFYLFFKSSIGKNLIDSITSGSVQMKFNKTDLRNSLIVFPCKNDMNNLITVIKKYIYSIENKKSENMQLIQLRDTLLPKLMSGEIEIPDDIEVNEDELSI